MNNSNPYDDLFKQVDEPSAYLLAECLSRLQQTNIDNAQHRLIGKALDRWNISKEELAVRARLIECAQ